MPTPVTAVPGSFPAGFCPKSSQEFYNEFFRISNWFLPDENTGVIKSSIQPDADNTNKLWYRLNGDQSPDKIFVYYNGTWVSPHAVPANSQEIRIWAGNLTVLETYDGGAPGIVTDLSGPMWERATLYDGKFLLGAGTLDGSGATKNLGDTGGVDEQFLTQGQLPEHTHDLKVNRTPGDDGLGAFTGKDGDTPQPPPEENAQTLVTESVGNGDVVPTIPPFNTIYWIQRTARKFYTP